MRTYITPHEIHIAIQNFVATERIEGSADRSGIGRPHYHFMAIDEHRYVVFNFSTGKLKTVQEPQGLPDFDFAKRWRGPQ